MTPQNFSTDINLNVYLSWNLFMKHGTTSCFTWTNKSKDQYEEIKEANVLSNPINEFSEVESGFRLDNFTKTTIKM